MDMTEQERMELLKRAVNSLDRNDRAGFREIMCWAKKNCPEESALYGEILLLTVAAGETKPEEMLKTLRQAEEKIGGSSKVLTPQSRFAENHYDALMLWGTKPGRADIIRELELNIRAVSETFHRLTGFGHGVYECFRAQLAYSRGEFEEAKRWASTEIYRGIDGQISLIRVYMLEILAGVAKHTMDSRLWHESYGMLRTIASGKQAASRTCREQAEVICAMLEMALGCLHDVPAWVATGDFGVIPTPEGYEIVSDRLLMGTLPCAMVTHMQYLSYSGEYVRALQISAMIQKVFGVENVLLSSYVSMLRAGCYINLNKPDYARRAIEEAMEYIAPDGLWLIAAEFVPVHGEMLYAAAAEYDESAPEKIRNIGADYWNKLTPLRNDMLRGTSEGLTKREQEVMNLAMKGHSNAEIAEKMQVSVRTVRFHLENVYSKLHISRRSKFVSEIETSGVYKLADWVKR